MPYKYTTKDLDDETMSKALGIDLPISTKQSIEICNFLRRRKLQRAKDILENVIQKKQAIPFKRFNKDMGHKRTTPTAGRYPINACKEILKMLLTAEANAQFKGLNTSLLVIKNLLAKKASRPTHQGRRFGREMKRTHIEVVLEEKEEVKKTKEDKKIKTKVPEEKSQEQKKDKK